MDATSDNYDGNVVLLEVEGPGGTSTFMANGGCSPSAYQKIASGLDELRKTIDAFGRPE